MFGFEAGPAALPGEQTEVESQFTIRLVEAKDVQDSQNPFAEVRFGKQVEKTRVQTGLFPGKVAKWNEKFKFEASPEEIESGQIKIVLCNQNDKSGRSVATFGSSYARSDPFCLTSQKIGSVTVDLSKFCDGKRLDKGRYRFDIAWE